MYLIGNGNIITGQKEMPYIESGAVVVEGDTIIELGLEADMLAKYKKAEYVNAQNGIIMPGFINAHSHIYSAFARGLNLPGKPAGDFLEILENLWWRLDRHLHQEAVYYSAAATYLEGIRYGVTTVIDHHASYGGIRGSLAQIARAAEESGVRTCLCYEVSDREGREKMLAAVEENLEFISKVTQKPQDMRKALFGLHASFTLSEETLSYIKERVPQGTGYHVHISEGKYDEIYTQKEYRCSVVERFYQEGILGGKTLAGHGIHISPKDMDILRKTGTAVIHNPESNMGNAVGAPDVLQMLEKGIMVGLGTDGYTNDMLESLKTANLLMKHSSKKPDRGFVESCQLLLQNNPRIASDMFGVTLGRMEKGAKADVIIMDYHANTPMHADNLYGHIMFGMSGSQNRFTMINGKIVYRNGEVTTVREAEVLQKCKEAATALWQELVCIPE